MSRMWAAGSGLEYDDVVEVAGYAVESFEKPVGHLDEPLWRRAFSFGGR